MTADEFDAWAAVEADAVESALHAWVPQDAPAGLGRAMRYGVLDGGKRVRPLLVLAAADAVNGLREAALRYASVAATFGASRDEALDELRAAWTELTRGRKGDTA